MSEFILKADVLRVLGDGKLKAYVGTEFEEGREIGRWEAIEAVKAMTAVDAMPVVHARWVRQKIGTSGSGVDCVFCSECRTIWFCEFKYCPNCGAKMDEED